jgi:hypothetical protein
MAYPFVAWCVVHGIVTRNCRCVWHRRELATVRAREIEGEENRRNGGDEDTWIWRNGGEQRGGG